MKLQIHKESGVSIRDSQSNEILYQESFEMALVDAELEALSWPDSILVRIFSLPDGRLAVVRETELDLRQEAPSPGEEAFYLSLLNQAEDLIEKQALRAAAEANPLE